MHKSGAFDTDERSLSSTPRAMSSRKFGLCPRQRAMRRLARQKRVRRPTAATTWLPVDDAPPAVLIIAT
ncbi:Uncharacterised protein [Burkholderia pseudomallei]|nr:Uncharacterised protein [Burkholderia pseudomallei]CAJ2735379.1 Uncharacterised protein [Burkholderia pseudomallei]CAJ2737004.1 Uncharacterised protein [Burkholderia pseudomallei]CAJ3441533.1 Uncharacterised protein [Burkholderia pseudomallei]CAJ3443541.1 Uncharacterised protein [Burkholderia pseudomallei]